MPVLCRRPGEEIVIDGDIRIEVVQVRGNRTRLGVRAPSDVRVDRKEVRERRSEEPFQERSQADGR